jgi:uncharacterized protein
MRKPWQTLVGAIMAMLVVVGTVAAGPFEDAHAAADQGNVEAQWRLGLMYRDGYRVGRDGVEALKWFKLSAKGGYVRAQLYLEEIYRYGVYGLAKNKTEAAEWYRLAAEQNNAEAQYVLGNMAYLGEGVDQDYELAVSWFHKAADQGNDEAQWWLGNIYFGGQGVLQDYVQAHMWLNLAAAAAARSSDKEYRDRVFRELQFLTSKMTPAQIAEAQKLASEWKRKQ